MPIEGRGFEFKDRVYKYYEHIVTDIYKKWPRRANECWQVPFDEWALLAMEDSMFSNAMQGMFSSIFLSFIVLLVTTQNYVLSLFSITVISLSIGTVLAAI